MTPRKNLYLFVREIIYFIIEGMSGWFGGIYKREAPPAADILIERLQDAHKIEDRRKTVADLKSILAKENNAVCTTL